ncbi:MAG TPA: rhodanese-like domain-containing protein [Acidimicrobiales bacterium]|nr:rhodanese-like domain-containing protein [Acidimicrobiales bacterium]
MDAIGTVDPPGARDLTAAGALLLDVRDDVEWSAGRAPVARHVVLAELPDRFGELDPATRVVCVCRSGGRSQRATAFLLDRGYDAVNLEGGMIAWVAAGLPLVGDGTEPVVI